MRAHAPAGITGQQQPHAKNGSAEAADHPDLVEHAAPSRLTVQRSLFSGPSLLVPDELYVEVERGSARRERTRLTVRPDSKVSTNTYFGRFPASFWQRWTATLEVRLELTARGSGTVALLASDPKAQPRTVAAERVTGTGPVVLSAAIDRFVDGGGLWFEATSDDETLVLEDARWTVESPEALRPTAVVICTFNRVDDCLNTLAALASDPVSLEVLESVYVIDQGSDPVESRPRLAELQRQLGSKLRYLRQPNLGGSGGFSRGLYEVTGHRRADHANVLFLDDDVLCEPDIFIRMTTFANCTADPVIVGGQMLYLLHPHQLHVGAEYANLSILAPAQTPRHALSAADLTGADEDGVPHHQDLRVDAGYNGWWSCLIPSEIVQDVGYPLPLFFQWDDIEYGFRARSRGYATVTLPGAAVWHADFSWKDWDEWHRYFNLRNSMITAVLHSPVPGVQLGRVLLAQLVRYLISMQYGLAATLIKAVEDFLAGPETLHDGGVAAAREIRTLRAEYPETVRHQASAVPGMRPGDYQLVDDASPPLLKRAVLVKRLVDALLGRHAHAIGAVRNEDSTWWHVSRFDTAVVTDSSQEGVRVRRYNRGRMLALAGQGVAAIIRLSRETDTARERYRAALPELSSRENWRRLFEL